jgi:hypothetical protein
MLANEMIDFVDTKYPKLQLLPFSIITVPLTDQFNFMFEWAAKMTASGVHEARSSVSHETVDT